MSTWAVANLFYKNIFTILILIFFKIYSPDCLIPHMSVVHQLSSSSSDWAVWPGERRQCRVTINTCVPLLALISCLQASSISCVDSVEWWETWIIEWLKEMSWNLWFCDIYNFPALSRSSQSTLQSPVSPTPPLDDSACAESAPLTVTFFIFIIRFSNEWRVERESQARIHHLRHKTRYINIVFNNKIRPNPLKWTYSSEIKEELKTGLLLDQQSQELCIVNIFWVVINVTHDLFPP